MRHVSDQFLLNISEVSAALVGLFLVGMFLYVETGFRRVAHAEVVQPYFRASTRIVLILYALCIGVSLALVVLELPWARVLFAVLSVMLVVANVDTARRSRGFIAATRSVLFAMTEIVGTIGVVILVVVPWALGGLHPTRQDLTWAILLSFGLGFISICAAALSAFEFASAEQSDEPMT